jgi:AraC family transcriptional regulator of adaptative response / DNA-3-methyladenine glycosylase II
MGVDTVQLPSQKPLSRAARTAVQQRRAKLARVSLAAPHESHRFVLEFRPPYAWNTLIAFLSARATPGVEVVEPRRYRRVVAIGDSLSLIDVGSEDGSSSLTLDVAVRDAAVLPLIVQRVRRMFDLDLDPSVLARHFAGDLLLAPRLAACPGIRLPRAWDPFELAVRAVLGQQVSVRAATTLAGRIAAAYGTPVDDGGLLTRLFPRPDQLIDAPLESSGVMPARARTIRALASAVQEGRATLDTAGDGNATAAALTALPGIGPWTASYIAMRGLGEADAFPSGDLILQRAAGGCTARALEARSQAWRPWRAYAVMLLWQAPVQ